MGLYDTGSCVTCMSEQTFNNLHPKEQRLIPNNKSFQSASGNRLNTKGVIIAAMKICRREVTHRVHVIPHLHEPLILGIDFIRDKGLGYCPRHHEFHWEYQCPKEHENILHSRETMTLPPLCNRVCRVKLSTKREHGSIGIATIQLEDQPWIQGGPVLTKVENEREVTVELYNASPVLRTIERATAIGSFDDWTDDSGLVSLEDLVDDSTIQSVRGHDAKEANRGSRKISEEKQFVDKNAKLSCGIAEEAAYRQLFYEHMEVFSKHKNDLGRCDLVQHEIHLKDPSPVYIKQFKIPEVHATSIEEQVREWLKLGIVQPSRSRFNSPIFVVKKKDGAFRLVQDFRALNAQTYPDRYSMRDVTDCIHEIGKSNSKIFSTIDLTSGFWQMVLKPECRPYTAFTVYGMGQFEFKTSPMGLLGCPASFQRLMEAAMKGIPNVLVYIDDVLVLSVPCFIYVQDASLSSQR